MGTLTFCQPRLVALFLLIVLSAGASALLAIGRQEEPTITNTFATVTTAFPGAEPARVESLVTAEIEDTLRGVAEVDVLQSLSATGSGCPVYAHGERYHSTASGPSIFSTKTENHKSLILLNFFSGRLLGEAALYGQLSLLRSDRSRTCSVVI